MYVGLPRNLLDNEAAAGLQNPRGNSELCCLRRVPVNENVEQEDLQLTSVGELCLLAVWDRKQ